VVGRALAAAVSATSGTRPLTEWMILIGGGILCPDCVTEDDIVANSMPEFWFDSRNDVWRLACRCEADLGAFAPHIPATEITCASCQVVSTVSTGGVGHTVCRRRVPRSAHSFDLQDSGALIVGAEKGAPADRSRPAATTALGAIETVVAVDVRLLSADGGREPLPAGLLEEAFANV
jgi:hypothetical protein